MRLRQVGYHELPGWDPAELRAVWSTYLLSCRAIVDGLTPLRSGLPVPEEQRFLARAALAKNSDPEEICSFFLENYRPMEVLDDDGGQSGFVTGYYEPEIDGALEEGAEFRAPVLGRPSDLIDMRGARVEGWNSPLEGARKTPEGMLEPYPPRADIEAGALVERARPVVWLRDHVEVFFAQVQGSARIRLSDGNRKRLVYAGRNGRPYTSIGKLLIAAGEIPAEEMSLDRLKTWLRNNGLETGQRGRNVLQANESYVFFRLEDVVAPSLGPIGAQGLPLSPLRSLAVDRSLWAYGTPVWIGADLSGAGLGDGPSGRLMVAQDTGSAIVGAARADLYIGSGDKAGEIAGLVRHPARFIAFLPVG